MEPGVGVDANLDRARGGLLEGAGRRTLGSKPETISLRPPPLAVHAAVTVSALCVTRFRML